MFDSPLMSVQELRQLLEDKSIVVIDTRAQEEYRQSHIPTAVNIRDIFTYLATEESGGLDALVNHFSALFGRAGLRPTDRVVVYEDAMDNGYGQSCRGWFLLKYLGHQEVSVLHGGYRAWLAGNHPTTDEVIPRQPTAYAVQVDPDIMVSTRQMFEALDHPSIVKLDCRDRAEWLGATSSPYGVDFCPQKGRIPGAVWVEWYRLMSYHHGLPWFRPPEDVLAICQQLGIGAETPVYIYCFKGARASHVLIALRLAGIRDVRNYFASWNDWSRDLSLPIEQGYQNRL